MGFVELEKYFRISARPCIHSVALREGKSLSSGLVMVLGDDCSGSIF